jgi:hypothetical protein
MIMINLLGFLGLRIVFHAHTQTPPFLETGFSPYASIKDRRKESNKPLGSIVISI